MNVTAFIFARGGSKGLPRKNLMPLAGKPLIAWSIETAKRCPRINRVIVSTDSEEIAAVAREWGADVPFRRPPELAGDNSPEWLAWQHAIRFVQAEGGPLDVFVSLPATSPLRAAADVENCITQFLVVPGTDLVITAREAARNPWFNMITMGEDGAATLAARPERPIHRRQDAPVVYDMTTVAYVARPQYVLDARAHFDGRVRAVIVPPARAIDIDDIWDFRQAEMLLVHRHPDLDVY